MLKRSRLLTALVTAAAIFAASPSYALVAWACTAKDSAGKTYSREVYGLFSLDTKPSATFWTLVRCRANSKTPDTCTIVSCKKTQD